jgi:ABC-type polysaccharide/polyol phosphate export permease
MERTRSIHCMAVAAGRGTTLELTDRPSSVWTWLAEIWRHREVLGMLSRADFQVRYKRASFGVLWAVVVPLLQSAVLAIVFSKVIKVGSGKSFAVYVLAGVIAWSYFAGVVGVGSTAIVDGSGLTDKVWFPRALLALVPTLANLVALAVSMLVLLAAIPILGVTTGPRLLLLVPATVLLVTFSASLSLCLSALHVYFRDVRYLVSAVLLVWFYVTPIVYPRSLLGSKLGGLVDLNPMTGIITIFQRATVGGADPWFRPLLVSVVVTAVLVVVGVEANRRYDRLFVDLL